MIADPRCETRRPVINMYMFELDLAPFDRIGKEGMVQLLRVLVKEIAVPLDRRNTRRLVNVGQKLDQRLIHRACLEELVKVAGGDDIRLLVDVQDRFNKRLERSFRVFFSLLVEH